MQSKEELIHALLRVDFDLPFDMIDRLKGHLDASITKEIQELDERIEQLGAENVRYASYLNDSRDNFFWAGLLGDELIILALFKVLEISSMKAFKILRPEKLNELSPKGRTPELNGKILAKFFDVEQDQLGKLIAQYEAFDELRLLNNSIKHNGFVSKELAETYPRKEYHDGELTYERTEGGELRYLDQDYQRLKPRIIEFYESLLNFRNSDD